MKRGSVLTRVLVRLLARQRGEVRAMQDLRHLQGVVRFTVLFALTVFVPAVLLAYLALGSLRAVEDQIDQELRTRAEQATAQVHRDLSLTFERFEHSTTQRLLRGQSALSNLSDLSPYLRAAFRFDAGGQLAAPFALPDSPPAREPPLRLQRLFDLARTLELRGDHLEAAAHYQLAAAVDAAHTHTGEAEYARARCLLKAGQTGEAERAFADVHADYANIRDRFGFRLGDLATLKRAELRLSVDPELGTVALQQLTEEILSARWTIGYPGESAVARRALRVLDGHADPDWLGRARTRLDERSTQLFWAAQLQDELELFAGTQLRRAPREFLYHARPDTGSLWATLLWGDDLYAFSFHQGEIDIDLRHAAAQSDALDEDVSVRLVGPRDDAPAGVLSREVLQPYLPFLTVEALPANPDELRAEKSRQRTVRLAVLFLLVGMTAVGVVLTARLLGQELEGARIKADFAANVSHELRSPLTQIRLKAEALILDLIYDDADRQAHYRAIVRETDRLSRLVDNVLDFSAIERGAKRYTFRPEDMGEIVTTAVDTVRSTIESRGLQLDMDVPDDLPVVWVDRVAVSQVVINLLSNALKYGADGGWLGVTARVGLDGVDITVADRGMGISPDEQELVFDQFYRSGNPKVRRRRGTGIGLAIVRYIVEAHGGTASVESTPGEGSSFTVTFPLEPQDGA